MKNKDQNWYQEKVQDIKRRKRNLRMIEDPKLVRKKKDDLKREQRGAKRSEKNNLKTYLKDEIDKFKNKED